jgi:hypothetical protein
LSPSAVHRFRPSSTICRPTFKKLVARAALIEGIAADDGAALHYVGGKLLRSVSCQPRLRRSVRHAAEKRLPTRYLGRAWRSLAPFDLLKHEPHRLKWRFVWKPDVR